MAITKAKKTDIVNDLAESIKGSEAVYLVDYSGIKVTTDNSLRKILRTKGISYKAAKNSLIKLALEKCEITGLDDYLVGVSAVLLGDSEDPTAPAKELVAFMKDNANAVKVKAINLDGSVLLGEKLVDVSKMPGRQELIAQIVTIALGPGANIVALLKGPGSKIAGQLKTLEEKLEN